MLEFSQCVPGHGHTPACVLTINASLLNVDRGQKVSAAPHAGIACKVWVNDERRHAKLSSAQRVNDII